MGAEHQRRAVATLFAAAGALIILAILSIAFSSPAGAADAPLSTGTPTHVTFENPASEPQLSKSAANLEGPDAPLFNGFTSFGPSALSDLLTPRATSSQQLESQNDAAISGIIRGPGGAPLAPGTSGRVTLYAAHGR